MKALFGKDERRNENLPELQKNNSSSRRTIFRFTPRSPCRLRRSVGVSDPAAHGVAQRAGLVPRTCAATGKSIITGFAPASGMVVYDRDYGGRMRGTLLHSASIMILAAVLRAIS